jgi:hypothetical protein
LVEIQKHQLQIQQQTFLRELQQLKEHTDTQARNNAIEMDKKLAQMVNLNNNTSSKHKKRHNNDLGGHDSVSDSSSQLSPTSYKKGPKTSPSTKKENFFQSWLLHTSEINLTAMIIDPTERDRAQLWRRNTRVISAPSDYMLFILLVENSRRGGICANDDLDSPTFTSIGNDLYASGLFILTSVNERRDECQAQFLGIIGEKTPSKIPSLAMSVTGLCTSKIPNSFFVPRTRDMSGLVGQQLLQSICHDAIPLAGQLGNTYIENHSNNNNNNISNNNNNRYENNNNNNNMEIHNIPPKNTNLKSLANQNGNLMDLNNSANVFYDMNNRSFSESQLKLNKNGMQSVEELAIVTRQFRNDDDRKRRLGNLNSFYVDYLQFAHHIRTDPATNQVVLFSVQTIIQSEIKFRAAVLWHWGIPNGLKLNDFLINPKMELDERYKLVDAIQNMERFLVLTFGSIWERCVEKFIVRITQDPQAQTIGAEYVQYAFETACSHMYNSIRTCLNVGDNMKYGEHFANVFSDCLSKQELTVINETIWKSLKKTIQSPTNSHKIDVYDSGTIKIAKQICYPFLKNALDLDVQGCTNNSCPRIHDDIFSWKKSMIQNQIQNIPNAEEVLLALKSSKKFA